MVVQDAVSGEILMLGYADRSAIELTVRTGLAHFYSRSRRRLWMKGETSGNVLRVLDVTLDCDYDAAFYLAVPSGNTCHTGKWSCFHNFAWSERLMDVLWDLLVKEAGGGSPPSPLFDCNPPPDPLFMSLAALALLRGYDRRVADAAAVVGGCPSVGIVMAQRLGIRAYVGNEPEERRIAVLGGVYDEGAREVLEGLRSSHEVKLAAFAVADLRVRGASDVRRLADLSVEGNEVVLRDVLGTRTARLGASRGQSS